MDGVALGASRAVLQSMIAGIAGGACASLESKMASNLGKFCSVGVTTAAGRVAGGVFMLRAEPAAKKLSTGNCYSASQAEASTGLTGLASNTRLRPLRRPVTARRRLGRPPAVLEGQVGYMVGPWGPFCNFGAGPLPPCSRRVLRFGMASARYEVTASRFRGQRG